MVLNRDLSEYGHPVSDLFTWPSSPEGWDHYRLSPEQLEFFEEYGYLSNVKLLDQAQVELWIADVVVGICGGGEKLERRCHRAAQVSLRADQSGYGREAGLESVLDYTRTKTVWINIADKPMANPFVMR